MTTELLENVRCAIDSHIKVPTNQMFDQSIWLDQFKTGTQETILPNYSEIEQTLSKEYEPSLEKTIIVDKHFSPHVDFLFRESLLYTSISLRRNVSYRIVLCGLRGLRRLI